MLLGGPPRLTGAIRAAHWRPWVSCCPQSILDAVIFWNPGCLVLSLPPPSSPPMHSDVLQFLGAPDYPSPSSPTSPKATQPHDYSSPLRSPAGSTPCMTLPTPRFLIVTVPTLSQGTSLFSASASRPVSFPWWCHRRKLPVSLFVSSFNSSVEQVCSERRKPFSFFFTNFYFQHLVLERCPTSVCRLTKCINAKVRRA